MGENSSLGSGRETPLTALFGTCATCCVCDCSKQDPKGSGGKVQGVGGLVGVSRAVCNRSAVQALAAPVLNPAQGAPAVL